ncbi:single-stranded DNA-binding protein [Microbacterium sp. A8/3-1]|uniref:Single-stranded DNA-binding protein n=1 Tax=Microbacterium sp. A8/3-1 TaxID=3160749 RepID=A0AAU7VVV2_9MICO
MSIHTQESVSGFVASEPQLTNSTSGNPRLYFRFGQEHFRREEDGTFTQLETSYHHLVMFGRSAERTSAKFAKGDNFLAEGYQRPVSYEREGQTVESEEFVAKRIGHDTARTRYDVDRSPRGADRNRADKEQSRAFDARAQPTVSSSPSLSR